MNDPQACQNTDRQIWRETPHDFYSDSIHITEGNGVGINHHGHVIVAPVKSWHRAAQLFLCVNPNLSRWRWKLGMWLLKAHEPIKYGPPMD